MLECVAVLCGMSLRIQILTPCASRRWSCLTSALTLACRITHMGLTIIVNSRCTTSKIRHSRCAGSWPFMFPSCPPHSWLTRLWVSSLPFFYLSDLLFSTRTGMVWQGVDHSRLVVDQCKCTFSCRCEYRVLKCLLLFFPFSSADLEHHLRSEHESAVISANERLTSLHRASLAHRMCVASPPFSCPFKISLQESSRLSYASIARVSRVLVGPLAL